MAPSIDLHPIEQNRGPPGQPDITYEPDYKKYLARRDHRLANDPETKDTALPDGWPNSFTGPQVWTNEQYTSPDTWTYVLTTEDQREVIDAVSSLRGMNFATSSGQLDKSKISKATFVLPQLGPRLIALANDVQNGKGFVNIRDVPGVKDFHSSDRAAEDVVIAYIGITSYFGELRGQQGKNKMLSHIVDVSFSQKGNITSPAGTSIPQVFHTDAVVDMISLFCISSAKEGGKSKISSIGNAYNELAKIRPDLIRTLASPWVLERRYGADQVKSYSRPIMNYYKGKLTTTYARRAFTGFGDFPRSSNLPPITEAQAEALDALHYTAEKHAVEMDLQPGDIQIINNYVVFHARDGYVDGDDPTSKRWLMRLWLHDPNTSHELPPSLQPEFDNLFKLDPAEEQLFPLSYTF